MQTTLALELSLATRDRERKGKHTQNINPQTLSITGVPADWVITKVVEP